MTEPNQEIVAVAAVRARKRPQNDNDSDWIHGTVPIYPKMERVMDDQERKAIGLLGEELALATLQANGLRLVMRNYRCKLGELDLVMLDGNTLVLVEVRTRSRSDYGGAAASVDWSKQRRLVRAAEHLLMKRAELRCYPARFDVVAITAGRPDAKVDWIKSAFTL